MTVLTLDDLQEIKELCSARQRVRNQSCDTFADILAMVVPEAHPNVVTEDAGMLLGILLVDVLEDRKTVASIMNALCACYTMALEYGREIERRTR